MRLICGLVMLDGNPVSPNRLQAMCDGLPQGSGSARTFLSHSGPAGLAVLDFTFAPESPSAGGLFPSPAGWMVAADVRLDEPDDLRRSLGTARTADSDITALAVDRWKRDASARLLGDFAFAAWNEEGRELLLARDSAGVRPLVYHYRPGAFLLFASFPNAVHASGLLPRELNEAALIHRMYLTFLPEETFSRGVLAVRPGHQLRLLDGKLTDHVYWRPALQPHRHKRPEAAAEELKELLTRAVTSRVRGSGPVAAHLSGGLDSSAIAVLASRGLQQQGRRLLGYSFLARPDERIEDNDETPFVQAVLAQEPAIEWRAVHPTNQDRVLQQALDRDSALSLDADNPENAVCSDASRSGAQLILSGWGGDEGATFNGRGMLADAFLRGRWLYLLKEMQAQHRRRGFGWSSVVRQEILAPLMPARILQMLHRVHGRSSLANAPDMLAPGPWAKEQHVRTRSSGGASVRRTQLMLLSSAHIAVRTTNWAHIGARYGMAFAFPMLDRRLIEFALSLPPTWHVREGWRRRPYRDAMQGVLPETIRWRHNKLSPLPVGLSEVLSNKRLMLQQASELEEHPRVREIFNMEAVRSLLRLLPEDATATSAVKGSAIFIYACAQTTLHHARYVAEFF